MGSRGAGLQSSKNSAYDMLSIRISSKRKCWGRSGRFLKQGELGDVWRRSTLCGNERISANKLSHT